MNKNLGIIDQEKALKLAQMDAAENQRAQAIQYQQDTLAGCTWANSKEQILIANKEHQLGKPMHFLDMENIIRKLPGGNNYIFFDFKDHPIVALRDRPFKACYYKSPSNSQPLMVSPYGKVILPEWGVMEVEEEYQPDLNIRHFDRKDLPEKVWKGWSKGYEYKDPSKPSPWKKKIVKTRGENPEDPSSRGWRTVFSRIVGLGLATPTQVEEQVGKSQRQSWQNHMGRRDDRLGY